MAPRPAARFAGQVRIIGGLWRRRLIRFPPHASLRPTPDRVRETLFNWLGQDLSELATLDLFAGSGALSFESLSRGARCAVAVDSSREAVDALRENAVILGAQGFEAHRANALEFLAGESRRFEVIYLDPPFDDDWLPRLWPLLPQRMSAAAFLYVEQPREIDPPAGWRMTHHRKAGRVHYHLLRFEPDRHLPEDSN
jgi:16S rRNA (guanine966-N2)-methyltransferase